MCCFGMDIARFYKAICLSTCILRSLNGIWLYLFTSARFTGSPERDPGELKVQVSQEQVKEGRGSPATSIVALLAWSASHCSFRLTHSGRFLLRRIAHWATASFVPLFHTEHKALQTSCRAKLLLLPFIYFQFHIARLQC